MESTRTKVEVMKPVLLKAGIPLAISVAGFIFARIRRRKISVSKGSQIKTPLNSSETNSVEDFIDEESFHSFDSTSLPGLEDEKQFPKDINYANAFESSQSGYKLDLEEGLLGLRCRVEDIQEREWNLEMKFLRYCNLKDQESILMELQNFLLLEITRVESLAKEISFMEAENRRIGDLIVEFLKLLEELKFSRMENGLLQRKVKKLHRKIKQRTCVIREQNLEIEARELEILGNHKELERRGNDIKKMEEEINGLKMNLDVLQEEKKELVNKLDLAEKSASSISKIVEEGITKEEYNQLVNELEQLQNDRTVELKELIYLRWSSACLRHELTRRNQEQEENEKHQMKLELRSASGEIGDLGLDHELDGSISGHGGSCLGIKNGGHAHSKRPKLIEKLKRWVEGSEKMKQKMDEREKHQIKCIGGHSASDGAEEKQQFPSRKSCSSA